MLHNKRILVVVPARGDSKGLKLKNIMPFNGIPLVGLVGKVVAELDFVDRAIVSTDHHEIARIAKESGLDVPFMRPKELSEDIVSDWKVLHHALMAIEAIDKTAYDIIVMLQPTCPLRRPEHVKQAVYKLIEGNYDAVWTISETDSKNHPLKQLVFENDVLDYYDRRGSKIIARQQLTPPVYYRNGAAYAFRRNCLLNQKTTKCSKTSALIISEPMISIDAEFDLKLATFILNEYK